jgi:DNA polymerase elongation subunit (family B)
MALVTAESTMVSKDGQMIPCVVLIGRDKEGKRLKWRTSFYPFCFLREEDFIRLSGDQSFHLKSVMRDYEGTSGRSLGKRVMTKVYFNTSKDLTNFDHLVRKWGKVHLGEPIYTYESDLSSAALLALRYLIDKEIKVGLEISDSGEVNPIEVDWLNLRKWYLDLETYSTKQGSFSSSRDLPIIMFSFWDSFDCGLYTLYVKNPKWPKPPRFKSMFKNHWIKGFETEGEMLGFLVDKVESMDPDLFTAWNLDRFDMVQWVKRMDKYEPLSPKLLSPFRSFSRQKLPFRIKGRICFDLMKAFKRFTDAEMVSYSLLYVVQNENLKSFIPLEKIPFKGSPAETWDKYPEVVFKRNVNDVLIIKALDEKHDLIGMFDDLRREFGALFHEVLMNYRVLDTALMRFIRGRIILGTSRHDKGEKKSSYLGAIVIDPVPGTYEFLAAFDFNREYPNIIDSFNIGPETYRDETYKGPCFTIKYKDFIYKFVKTPKSLIAQLIESFFRKRDEYEKEYDKAITTGDKNEIHKWWRRVFNIKKMTNAIYGVMDFSSFRLHRKECSAATVVIARIAIEHLAKKAKEIGYKILYGDTDSIFVPMKSRDREESVQEGQKLAVYFNEVLSRFFIDEYGIEKAPSNLGLKKVYGKFLLVAKKFYAGKYFWDEKKGYKEDFDFKGLEVIRSDSSDVERSTLETMVKMILSGEKGSIIQDFWRGVTEKFNMRFYGYLDVSYPLQIKHKFTFYNQEPEKKQHLPSHIRSALYSNKFLNTDFGPGDKPRRLPVKSKKVWDLEFKGKILHLELKDVSVTEDMVLPDWILKSVDWSRIYNRLAEKVHKILQLINVQSSLEAFK